LIYFFPVYNGTMKNRTEIRSGKTILIMGSQLLSSHPALTFAPNAQIVMIEAEDLCRRSRYHKMKLVFVLTAMRSYCDWLQDNNRSVAYYKFRPDTCFKDVLRSYLRQSCTEEIIWMAGANRGVDKTIQAVCRAENVRTRILDNQQFLTPRIDFERWLTHQKTPRMESFYRWQRKRLDILIDNNEPVGGKWNFDQENRKPLPRKGIQVPDLPHPQPSSHEQAVRDLVANNFGSNPGFAGPLWLPVDRKGALEWLYDFVNNRLPQFGPYEDAMQAEEPFLFHSVLSPLLNIGLVSAGEIVTSVLASYSSGNVPLASTEGFIRQVIGWREYMNGWYWQYPNLKSMNYFGFDKELEPWWYSDAYQDQTLPIPVRSVLRRVHRLGYAHHIERLMVLGNWFLLNQYDPRSVTRWFTAMFLDAYPWVMVPNVMGMSQYADGGKLASKPYICGGNYLQKMGRWWKNSAEARESVFTDRYWSFIQSQTEKLRDNPRLALVLRQASNRKDKHLT